MLGRDPSAEVINPLLAGCGTQGKTRTALVVEDNPGDARLVEFYLLDEVVSPFKVLKAERLSAALAVIENNPVDVVLLDLSLPDSQGLQTLEKLRAALPLTPVVVLTGNSDEALALQALRQGAQDYLVKGAGDGDLVRRAVRYAIERSCIDVQLRRSEEQFRAVFENAAVGVALSDGDGRFVDVNPAFCAMLGYAEAELVGLRFHDITHSEDLEANLILRAQMQAGQRDRYTLTKRYIARDGRVVWAKIAVSVVRDEAGMMLYTISVVEDVTEQKRLEDQTRLAAIVFESSGDGLFVTDARGHIVHVNPAFTDITGYGSADVLGKNPRMLASGRHDADFYRAMWQSLEDQGRWQGEIWDRRQSGEMFAGWQTIAAVRNSMGEVTNYVSVISDITARKQHEERLSYQANHDPLTRLPNRTLFQERLSRAIARAQRNQSMVALLFIDLDRFKQVNDTLGHLAGDRLLVQVSERLTNSVRQGDTVARLSGDEFTVILEDVQDPRDAAVVAHKILHALVESFDLNGHEARISSSIGVSIYPADTGDAASLIKLADAAMYRAKAMGRNACQFHSEVVNAQAFERLALENALQHALDQDQFLVHYQPVFDLLTGKVVDVEALLRWRHPEVGLVVPAQFMALAEETGLIEPIGAWMLEQSCRQARMWLDQGHDFQTLHVNLCARQIRQPDLVDNLARALETSRLPPSALILDVCETAAMDRSFDAAQVFNRIRALGVGLGIDDFGSGYSSLSSLKRLPVNGLKISVGFIQNLTEGSREADIVSAILSLGRSLRLPVVALGIETPDQLATLSALGCQRGQGFLLAGPMPAQDLGDYFSGRKVATALQPAAKP